MKVRLLLLVCVLGVAACAVGIVARRQEDGPEEQNATPHAQSPGTSEQADGSRRNDLVVQEQPRMGIAVNENAKESQEDPGKGGAPRQLTESQQGSAREDGISLERAVTIARKAWEGVSRIPDDAIVETKREGETIVVTFRMPIKKPLMPGGTYYARVVLNAKTGAVIWRMVPDA